MRSMIVLVFLVLPWIYLQMGDNTPVEEKLAFPSKILNRPSSSCGCGMHVWWEMFQSDTRLGVHYELAMCCH